MLLGLGAFVVLFLVVLLLINFITNKEEGTLVGIDFNALSEEQRAEVRLPRTIYYEIRSLEHCSLMRGFVS